MIKEISYGRKIEYGAFGRNGAMHQTGLSLMLMQRDKEVCINPVNSHRTSFASRMSIPIEKIDEVIETLQTMKAKALQETSLSELVEANREVATFA